MDNLTKRLKNRIEVWGNIKIENELGEVDYKEEKIKSIWAEIKCVTGSVKTTAGDIIQVDMKYKFTIRSNSIKELKNDMYLKYKGQKYNIDYSISNFKYKDCIEVYCTLEDVKWVVI